MPVHPRTSGAESLLAGECLRPFPDIPVHIEFVVQRLEGFRQVGRPAHLPPRPGLITPAEWPRSLTHAGLDSVDIRPDHRQTREISSSLFSAMAMDPPPILIFLGQAAILIALPYLLWRQTPLQRIAPLVVVQILVGLGLGPSLLGQAVPPLASVLLQGEGLAALSGLAWLAVVMFAFLTGLHFDTAEISGRRRGFFATALASILVPALLGLAAGVLLFDHGPGLAGASADRWLLDAGIIAPTAFSAFVLVAVATTAATKPMLLLIDAIWHRQQRQ